MSFQLRALGKGLHIGSVRKKGSQQSEGPLLINGTHRREEIVLVSQKAELGCLRTFVQ